MAFHRIFASVGTRIELFVDQLGDHEAIAVVAAAVLGIAAATRLLADLLDTVEINTWVALSIAGIVLVLASSLWERYALAGTQRLEHALRTLASWHRAPRGADLNRRTSTGALGNRGKGV